MDAHLRVFVIVEARAAHFRIVERKPKGLDQMKPSACIGAQTNDVAGIRRDFGFHENDVEHDCFR
jgi:hypothetical protein